MDIIIRNGYVIDPYNKIKEIKDIGISNGYIAKVGNLEKFKAVKEYDASGCIVTPGLIDYHAHVSPLCEIGIPAEIVGFSSGVTTIVDAGSTGCSNYESYRQNILSQNIRIKCCLNVCSAGLVTDSYLENINPKNYNREKIIRLFEKYPDELVGLKIRLDKRLTDGLGIKPLLEAIELAEEIGTRLIVHTTNSEFTQSKIAGLLRSGDVFTHMYHDFDNSIINDENKVYDEIKKSRERGVIFDAANARFHFSFKVANIAIKDKFLPDIISTDLTKKSMYKKPQIFNMAFLMSKYLNMGLDINSIVKMCTSTPAKLLNMEKEIGQLGEGVIADIAIFKIIDKQVIFEDWDSNKIIGNELIRNMLTIKDGITMFQDIEFN